MRGLDLNLNWKLLISIVGACAVLQGCAVASSAAGAAISVTGAVVSTGITLTGKAAGAAINAMTDDNEDDNSGVSTSWTYEEVEDEEAGRMTGQSAPSSRRGPR